MYANLGYSGLTASSEVCIRCRDLNSYKSSDTICHRTVSDAIYSGVPGATFDQDDGVWILPCDQELSLTFKFAGVSFPIHPLDINQELTTTNGSNICIGAVRSFSPHIYN